MKNRVILLISLGFVFHALGTMAQPPARPQLSTSFVSKRLTVGDQFLVGLKLLVGNDAKITGPLADSLGPFMVVGQKEKTRAHKGYNEHFYDLKLAGFRPGSFSLPKFLFIVAQGDRVDSLWSDTLKVVISSVLPEKMQDINDLKPAEAFPNHWLWIIPLIIVLLGVMAFWLRRLYRRLKRFRQEMLSPLSPWDEALRDLDRIPVAEWLAQEKYKLYYYTLSEITKRYLERRFRFNAVEQTTSEIIASMKQEKVPERDGFGQFLSQADLVKYAKIVPPRSEMEKAIDRVRHLVERTKPISQIAESQGKEAAGKTP